MTLKTWDCFHELRTKSEVADELYSWCRSQSNWTTWKWTSFLMKFPPKEIIEKDPVITTLMAEGWKEPLVLRNYPHSFYTFHIDRENRPCSLNLQLGTNVNSHTMFTGGQYAKNQIEALEVKYKPNTYVLLNTHRPHGIFNLQYERYTFSLNPPADMIPDWWDNDHDHSSNDKPIQTDFTVYEFFKEQFQSRNL